MQLIPRLLPGSSQYLKLESPLKALRLWDFVVEANILGKEVAQIFAKYPCVPGVILQEQSQFLGIISRSRFLEFLLRPQGLDLFLEQPLELLYSYARYECLLLSADTPILTAARLGLARSREFAGEPIIVKSAHTHHLLDWHQLNTAAWQIRGIETQVRYERNQIQMIQTEKMANLGRLVNGVAHEILDPVGFIWGNLSHVSDYHDSLLTLLNAYESEVPEQSEPILKLKEDLEFDYLRTDLPKAIESITSGAKRLKTLVTALQNFCHIDEVYPKPADLNTCLDNILLLIKTRLDSQIKIVDNYGNLPPVSCYIGQLSQVFINIITNAIDTLIVQAVAKKYAQETQANNYYNFPQIPCIEITTKVLEQKASPNQTLSKRWISIEIADNGMGIPPVEKAKILDSFSIAQRTAKETSLSLSYQIVTANHGGKLTLNSRSLAEGFSPQETGTKFTILLPLT